jgi:hypothetical protein
VQVEVEVLELERRSRVSSWEQRQRHTDAADTPAEDSKKLLLLVLLPSYCDRMELVPHPCPLLQLLRGDDLWWKSWWCDC